MLAEEKNYSISKILPFEFAVDFLLNNKLFFSKPSSWDDPFEKLNDRIDSKMIFAQCWCKTSYSDAMWRIFSQSRGLKNNGPGIQIRTKVNILSEIVKNSINFDNFYFKHRSIEYISLKDYKQKQHSHPQELPFLKRNAFKHEQEYRFILIAKDNKYDNLEYSKGIKIDLNINIKEIINHVWIDPFSSNYLTKAIEFFLNENGISCEQSKIYTEPDEKLRRC